MTEKELLAHFQHLHKATIDDAEAHSKFHKGKHKLHAAKSASHGALADEFEGNDAFAEQHPALHKAVVAHHREKAELHAGDAEVHKAMQEYWDATGEKRAEHLAALMTTAEKSDVEQVRRSVVVKTAGELVAATVSPSVSQGMARTVDELVGH